MSTKAMNDLPSIDEENAALRRQLAEQATRIAALEAKITPQASTPPADEERPLITREAPSNRGFIQPTVDELRALFVAVSTKYPELGRVYNQDSF